MTARRVLLALALALQLVVLYAPSSPSGGGVPHLDKAVHAAVFAAVAWAAPRAGVPVVATAVALVAHAVLSEVVQAALL